MSQISIKEQEILVGSSKLTNINNDEKTFKNKKGK